MDRKTIKDELVALHSEGEYIYYAGIIAHDKDYFKNSNEEVKKIAKEKSTQIKYPQRSYQAWYDKARRMVRRFMPERLEEFEEIYTGSKHVIKVNDLDPMTAGIKHYIEGWNIPSGSHKTNFFHKFEAGFKTQGHILLSIAKNFDDPLFNLENDIHLEIYKSEMDIAKEFQEHENLRMAGAIASLVIEVHLKNIAIKHGIPIKEKTEVSDYNNFLKRKGVCDSGLADQIKSCKKTRNKCIHTDKGDPSVGEVSTIIHIADRVINEIN